MSMKHWHHLHRPLQVTDIYEIRKQRKNHTSWNLIRSISRHFKLKLNIKVKIVLLSCLSKYRWMVLWFKMSMHSWWIWPKECKQTQRWGNVFCNKMYCLLDYYIYGNEQHTQWTLIVSNIHNFYYLLALSWITIPFRTCWK